MRTLTQKEYEELYGKAGVNVFQEAESTKPTQSTAVGRLGEIGQNTASTISNAINGTGQFQGQTAPVRGVEAVTEAFGVVPKAVVALSPEPVRQVVDKVGDTIGKGFDFLTDKIASTKLFSDIGNLEAQGYINPTDNPGFYALKDVLQTSGNIGEIAGTIAGTQGTVSTLTKGVDLTKKVSTSVGNSTGDIIQTTKDAFNVTPEQIASERAAKITKGFEEQNTRLKSADKSFTKNTITRKTPAGEKVTITPIDTFAKHNIAPLIEKGSIQMGDYRNGVGQLGKIKSLVENLDNDIDTKLVNSGQKIKIEDLKQKAIDNALKNEDFRQSGTVSQNIARIESRFEDYATSYGDEIDVAELNNIRKTANRDYSPDTQDVSRVVGDTAREYVYNASPEVRGLLQKQGELLAARKYAETINGTKVVGGRLGNMALRTAGAIAGSGIDKLPVIGPVAGMIGGEFAARALQQSQFKSLWTELRALLVKEANQTDNVPTKSQI